MKQHLVRCLYAAAGVLALPAVACAQSQAYTNTTVNVRAGPAPDYPVVTQLPGGVPLSVMGCISNYQWCDVAAPNLRGWVYAGSLSYPYQGANVPVMNYGMVIGLPIVTFSIGAYWGDYYRGRPWYGQQSRWAHHPPPPPPRPGAGRPPGHDGGRPPGGRPPGHDGGRPPGGPP
ncbi:SH3 domain-containing protein, partial [Paraburkholderia dipogonis]